MKKNTNILVLTYWSFNDPLIQTYTLPYVKIIADTISKESKIFVLTLEKNQLENIKPINNINFIPVSYNKFGLKAIFKWFTTIIRLLTLIKKEKIDVIHCWCTPAGAIGYILSILSNKDLIIDSYEPHAEAMVENGTWKKNSLAFRILFLFEKLQTHRAKYLIAATESMKHYAEEKFNYSDKNNFFSKPACVDFNLFNKTLIKSNDLINKYNLQNKIICVYAGKFGGIYLDDEVFHFFKIAENYWPNHFTALILSSHSKDEIIAKAKKAGLSHKSFMHFFVPHNEIPKYIGLADFALTPVKPVPTKKYCTPIKNGEYWAMGLPVVITKNISDDSEIIEENEIGAVLYSLNEEEYLKAIKKIDYLLKKYNGNELYNKIRKIAEKHRNFEIASSIYKKIYSFEN